MNPIDKAFLNATIKEQEEFCVKRHRILCRIIRNRCEFAWCRQVLEAWKEKLQKDYKRQKNENK